jgi:hypothetical protein
MGRAIPSEWTVNLLELGKEPWRLKDLEDQLNMNRQQWQMVDAVVLAKAIPAEEDAEDVEEAEEDAAGEETTVSNY